jgi:hypothetical protein
MLAALPMPVTGRRHKEQILSKRKETLEPGKADGKSNPSGV